MQHAGRDLRRYTARPDRFLKQAVVHDVIQGDAGIFFHKWYCKRVIYQIHKGIDRIDDIKLPCHMLFPSPFARQFFFGSTISTRLGYGILWAPDAQQSRRFRDRTPPACS
ncbi:MAG: hypothetical protein ABIK64_01240, partial [Bacillota bacterium]